ncbi:Bifunctional hemolysin/adenylate cyclase precursor [Pelagimonas phthalicica]|uniref:Bifunctional hemolysin/adenylate cyclase n=1 Tax=Pelagimonas phthalicica TaxID=1037362 RepID=A0A238JI16_9RHOB|nr:calcium-binding protein [Pelagimonas phthalicica]TDS89234.1 Ca2+-binding RTX toxin-like protein [Pelagimonas phthalicica]SMX29592.1 Bifunctional hemolysin/adenylate cyclase precursor [Pelagimonas phthalicica]
MPRVLYVDATATSPQGDGSSPESPYQTLAAAIEAAEPGDTICLAAGGHYALDNDLDLTGLSFASYGEGEQPVVDLRQTVQTTWEQVSDTVWRATVTYRDTPDFNNGTAAHSTHHQVWSGMDTMAWQFDGATIADNIAAVAATEGSFTIHETGSTLPDPRNGPAGGSSFEVYVHVPPGQHPSDLDLSLADQAGLDISGMTSINDVALIGAFSKDSLSTNNGSTSLGGFVDLHDVTILDAPSHGIVGPFSSTGTLTVTGRGNAGDLYHDYGWNSSGGLINIYTDQHYDEGVHFDTIVATNGYKALYGHGSTGGTYGYTELTVQALYVDTVDVAIDMSGYYNDHPFVEEILVEYIEAYGISTAVATSGNVTINGGSLNFVGADGLRPVQAVFSVSGYNQVLELHDVTLQFDRPVNPLSQTNALITGNVESVASALLILDGVQDISEPGSQAYFWRYFDVAPQTVIMGGTNIGNLQALTGLEDRAIPAVLIVEAGSTFGLGDRTGPEIEAFLASLGIPFWISSDTTIVGRDGTVLSEPGWQHASGLPESLHLIGTSENEALAGTLGEDTLEGHGGHDVLGAGDGDDFLSGGSGDDTLLGGDGDDMLMGGSGRNVLDGGAGTDWVSFDGSAMAFYYNSQNGQAYGVAAWNEWSNVENFQLTDWNDTFVADNTDNVILAGNGNDRLWGGGGNDELHGGAGNDRLTSLGDGGQVILNGGTGNDSLQGGYSDDIVIFAPGDGADILRDFTAGGTTDHIDLTAFGSTFESFEDVMAAATQVGGDVLFDFGNGDSILIRGVSLSDFTPADFQLETQDTEETETTPGVIVVSEAGGTVVGTEADETIISEASDTFVFAGAGDDTLISGNGADVLNGGAGSDWVSYENAQASFYYNSQNGQAYGVAALDQWTDIENFHLTAYNDTFVADGTDNIIMAGDGDDRLWGGGGNDELHGGAGNDRLTAYGNGGRVILNGGTGDDILVAGYSDDVIVFTAGDGADTLSGFHTGGPTDAIDLSGFGTGLAEFDDVMALASQQGDDVLLDFGNGDSILIQNVNLDDFTVDDFLF